MTDDSELMAALFVSEEGEIVCRPEWIEDCQPHWPWQTLPFGLPEPIAAGILRLTRERDEARHVAEAYAEPHSEQFAPPWEGQP